MSEEHSENNDKNETKKEQKTTNVPESVAHKRGVCYMSVIPPRMDSIILNKILSKRFNIERVYLEKENQAITRSRQKQRGGRKNVRYTEGWIEFATKKEAKLAALALNNQLIGGKKRKNSFHDDRWNLKYLSGFKWHHLTEKLVYD